MAGKEIRGAALPLNRALLLTGSRVCVAVSGGADSTALLVALSERSAELGIGLSAAHLHHRIRADEADGDRQFLRDLCFRLQLPLFEKEMDVPSLAAARGETLEEAARYARLHFFAELMVQGRMDAVATAHTEDDQAETVMMKLLRGAWTEGLSGIAPVLPIDSEGSPVAGKGGSAVGAIVRPLLEASREQVVAFLHERNQSWREDSTNALQEHTRNRIRGSLMPLLREFNPRVASALSTVAELAREDEACWSSEAARLFAQLVIPGRPVRGGGRAVSTAPEQETISFELERLRGLDMPLRRRLLRLAAERLGVHLSSAETLRVLLLSGMAPPSTAPDPTVPTKPNSRLQLRSGLRAERSLRELRFTRLP